MGIRRRYSRSMLLTLLSSSALAQDLVVVGARLWDGTGAPVREDAWILIRDGRIDAIGDSVPPDPATLDFDPELLELDGATVLPGLIDAHVHLTAVPGAPFREESEAERLPHIRDQLPTYVAAGVTTVLDTGIFDYALEGLRAELAAGQVGPRLLTLGPLVAPDEGYPAAIVEGFPSVASPDEVGPLLDHLVELETVGVKTTVEAGFVRPIWPLYTDEVFAALHDEAAARELPIYVHATHADLQLLALERLKPHAFVHPPLDAPDELVAALVAEGTYVMPTMALMDMPLTEFQPERLEDPWLQQLVPPTQLATAQEAGALDLWHRHMVGVGMPSMPEWFRGFAAWMAVKESLWTGRVADMQAVMKTLHDAGVPLVLGSDAGSYEHCPYYFHGVASIRELELLGETIGHEAALVAATRTPAEMLGRDDLGTVEAGKVADLVVVGEDPLESVTALRSVRYTIQGGVARTPEQWLAGETE